LLLWEADEPDHVEDVTATIDAKVAALLEHRSQYRSTMLVDDPSDEAQVARFRRQVLDRAAEVGRSAGAAYGESFRVVRDL
jgi:LmbE family N-acetylglucosaminyl deacetylase